MDLRTRIFSVLSHPGFRKYFANTSWLFLEKALRLVVGFFVGVWVARYLGPEQYGLLSYAQAFVGLFTAFASLGLDGILMKAFVIQEKEVPIYLWTSFYLRIFMSIVTIAFVCILGIVLHANEELNLLIIIVSFSLLRYPFETFNAFLLSRVKANLVAVSGIISLVIASVFKLLLIALNLQVFYFATAISLESLVLSFCLLFFTKQKFEQDIVRICKREFYFRMNTLRILMQKGLFLALSGFIDSIHMRIDTIFINHFLGSSMVGQYSVATSVGKFFIFIPLIIRDSLFTSVVSKYNNKEIFLRRIRYLFFLYVILFIIIYLPLIMTADFLFARLYGYEYYLAPKVFKLYSCSFLAIFLALLVARWYVVEDKIKMVWMKNLSSAIVNCILNYLWIPKYGLEGAVYATIISSWMLVFSLEVFSVTYLRMWKNLIVGLGEKH